LRLELPVRVDELAAEQRPVRWGSDRETGCAVAARGGRQAARQWCQERDRALAPQTAAPPNVLRSTRPRRSIIAHGRQVKSIALSTYGESGVRYGSAASSRSTGSRPTEERRSVARPGSGSMPNRAIYGAKRSRAASTSIW